MQINQDIFSPAGKPSLQVLEVTTKFYSVLRIIVLFPFLSSSFLYGQSAADTLSLSLDQTEAFFLSKNYLLLAQRYNIDIAEANIRQAKLWDNPTVQVEHVFYDPVNKNILGVGGQDVNQYSNQYQLFINQVIRLAGKRGKLIEVSKSNKRLNMLAFEDLMRSLKLQLRLAYAKSNYLLERITLLKRQEEQMAQLVEITKIGFNNGVVSGYDVTRIQFTLQNIQASMNDYLNQLYDVQNDLKVLLNTSDRTFIKPTEKPSTPTVPLMETALLDSALQNSPQARLAKEQITYQEASLTLEKSRSIPDLNLGFDYDKFGNAYPNYSGLNATFNLPLFNRNQHIIKIAKYQLDNSRANLVYSNNQVIQDVEAAIKKWQEGQKLAQKIQPDYVASLRNLNTEAIANYNRRTIGLIDFMDKINTYINAQINLIDVRENLYRTQQTINYVCNSKIF